MGAGGGGALRDYLKNRKLPEFVLSFEQIEEIIGAALPRAAQRASWWETLRGPQVKMPQREACLAGDYIATRLTDGKTVRFKRVNKSRPFTTTSFAGRCLPQGHIRTGRKNSSVSNSVG
jgi:hypothetical protein